MSTTRRVFLGTAATLPLLARARADEALPPTRALTKGAAHWFGYYDKWEVDPTDRYVLGMKAGFEGRQPTPEDTIEIGMVDLRDGDKWITLGDTRAWCWQQGCMLQWLPGSRSEIIWNDRDDKAGTFVSHVMDVKTRKRRTLPGPIYAVSPDGRTALTPDFRRLADTRPGYGYAGIADPNRDVLAPKDAGIWQMDLRSGKRRLVFSFAAALELPHEQPWAPDAKHWFNHLLFAPDGKRFVFLHRYIRPSEKKWQTRMITMRPDGTDPYVLNPHGMTSHFIWRDPQHILAWAAQPKTGNKFYLFRDKSAETSIVGDGVLTEDGHCTYLPRHRNEWIVNDTYPSTKDRTQEVHLFHVPSGRRVSLGKFPSPSQYTGPWRCDTHPRVSRDGTKIIIDSPHAGARQIYLIDVSKIVGPPVA